MVISRASNERRLVQARQIVGHREPMQVVRIARHFRRDHADRKK